MIDKSNIDFGTLTRHKLEALLLDLSFRELPSSIKSEKLRPRAESFVANVDRVQFLINLLPMTATFASVMSYHMGEFQAKVSAVTNDKESVESEESSPFTKTTKTLMELGWVPGKPIEFSREIFFILLSSLSSMEILAGDYADKAFGAWLSAMIIGAWTAFETLAGDLWVDAVNSIPQILAPLSGKPCRIEERADVKPGSKQDIEPGDESDTKNESETDPEIDSDIGDSAGKRILLGDVHKVTRGTYNLTEKMGELLLVSGRVKFTSLSGIREAYSLAFSEKTKRFRPYKIDGILSNKELDALSLVRNLIVHKAGLADEIYINDAKGIPLAPKLSHRELLKLDGELARSLIHPAITSGVELIKAVDIWMQIFSDPKANQ
jgi:hypothetical protein